jgi:hypothetical protein
MGVVLMAMTIGGLFAAAILLIFARFSKISWLRTFVLGGVTTWLTGYVILLLIGSIFSVGRTLGLNEPKEFCGFYLDCHLHTAGTDVQKVKTYNGKTANGDFYIVKVKVFSDAKRAELGFDYLKLFVIDGNGKLYPRFTDAENPEQPFAQKIPAGGSFEKEVVFDLPSDLKNPRLDMSTGDWIEKVLVGGEDSIFTNETIPNGK